MRPRWLYNADLVDAQPAELARARGNDPARQLAHARLLLRRKRDGRYLALLRQTADGSYALQPLDGDCARQRQGLLQLLACLGLCPRRPLHSRRPTPLRPLPRQHTALPPMPPPLLGLLDRLDEMGIDAVAYAAQSGLSLVPEPPRLLHAGTDRYGRPLWLLPGCAEAWQAMRGAARAGGIRLDAISGFRGVDYQRGIFERKRRRGASVAQILKVNAAPGFSEHHGGRALDIGTPGEPAAEESFELTPAFAWLCQHAGRFGFRLSYPRDNPHGILYEPWHWYWCGRIDGAG